MIQTKNGIEYEFIKAKEESKFNLIFIHGIGFNKSFFLPIVNRLTEFNCYMIDLPGHGGSLNLGYTFENYINAVSDFIREVDNAVIIGHSIGGTIALAAALRRIHNIKGVMIIGGGAESFEYTSVLMDSVKEALIDKNSFEEIIGHTTNILVRDALKHLESERVILNDLKVGMSLNILNSIDNIDVPLFILAGEEDKLYPVQYAEHIHEKIKQSKLIKYKETGNMLPLVKSEEVIDEIKNLIDTI